MWRWSQFSARELAKALAKYVVNDFILFIHNFVGTKHFGSTSYSETYAEDDTFALETTNLCMLLERAFLCIPKIVGISIIGNERVILLTEPFI